MEGRALRERANGLREGLAENDGKEMKVNKEDWLEDLPHDEQFYKNCEDIAHIAYDRYKEYMASSPFGEITIDELFEAASWTPETVMSRWGEPTKEGGAIFEFIINAAAFGAVMIKLSEGKGGGCEKTVH